MGKFIRKCMSCGCYIEPERESLFCGGWCIYFHNLSQSINDFNLSIVNSPVQS